MLTRRLCRATTSAVLAIGIALTGIITTPTHAAPEGVPVPTFRGGTVATWGDAGDDQDQVPTSLAGKTVVGISAGVGHTLAITSDGRITAWGRDNAGQATVPATLAGKTVTAVAAGGFHSLALTSDGTITGWGANDDRRASAPASLTGKTVTAIAAGGAHSLALTSDGKVTAWGSNTLFQTDVPESLFDKRVTAIAAGASHSLALTSDGKVTAWGNNDFDQAVVPDDLASKTVTAIAAGANHSVALTSDGKVTVWGSDNYDKKVIPTDLADKTVTAIATGHDHILALTSDSKVTAWGRNTLQQSTVPPSLTGRIVTAIAANGAHSLAIATGFAAEAAPAITGIPTSGSTLAAVPSRYTGEPDSLGYQWYADGVAIPGATTPTLVVAASHVGKRITVQVTATKVGHPTIVTSSAPVGMTPTVQLEAAKPTVRRGQSTTLTWSSTDATSLAATGAWTGTRAATGTLQVKPTALGTTTYVLTATNSNATTTAQVQVKVTRPATRLKITAPKGDHRPGTKIKVKVRGLEAGEKYTLRIGKKKVATGTAKNNRPLVRKIKLPKTTGKANLRVTGDQPDRTGTTKLRVVRR